MIKMVSRRVQCVMAGVFLEQLLLTKWRTALFLLAHITGEPPEVHESCYLFKCESARKSYLKDYLMAISSLAEPKGQLP